MENSIFYCTNCGRPIFHSEDIIKKVMLWDLQDYQAEAYAIKKAIDIDKLRRYDCSLHEGWYCCRFIMMRMIQDKFGTGDDLLVYVDSVKEYPEGETPKITPKHPSQINLSLEDYDIVTSNPTPTLKIVKIGGIWCPPCRLMDTVIEQIVNDKLLPGTEFFEVDIDQEQKLAERFPNQSIPYILYYYNGKKIKIESDRFSTLDGGTIGGFQKDDFIIACKKILEGAKEGKEVIKI